MFGALAAVALHGQATAPAPETAEALVDRFFRQAVPPDPGTYYTKDMAANYRNSAHLGAKFATKDYAMSQETFFQDSAATGIVMHVEHTPSKSSMDYYVFLKAEGGRWKLDALRQFVVPPTVGQVFAVLSSRKDKLSGEELSEMTMIRSFTTSNADLEAAFRKDETTFEELAKEAMARSSDEVVHAKRRDRSVPQAYWDKVKQLELYYVQLQRKGWFECAKASLGPSSVGYLWVHPAADPPRPSPDSFIYLKKLTPQWYLFRRQQ